jgi:hypothetical protein
MHLISVSDNISNIKWGKALAFVTIGQEVIEARVRFVIVLRHCRCPVSILSLSVPAVDHRLLVSRVRGYPSPSQTIRWYCNLGMTYKGETEKQNISTNIRMRFT